MEAIEAGGTLLAIGAALATLVAMIKMAVPTMPPRAVPLVVLVLSGVLVGLGVASGAIPADPLGVVLQVVAQAAATLGIREGVVAAIPAATRTGP